MRWPVQSVEDVYDVHPSASSSCVTTDPSSLTLTIKDDDPLRQGDYSSPLFNFLGKLTDTRVRTITMSLFQMQRIPLALKGRYALFALGLLKMGAVISIAQPIQYCRPSILQTLLDDD